jgi:hypothetical protein
MSCNGYGGEQVGWSRLKEDVGAVGPGCGLWVLHVVGLVRRERRWVERSARTVLSGCKDEIRAGLERGPKG